MSIRNSTFRSGDLRRVIVSVIAALAIVSPAFADSHSDDILAMMQSVLAGQLNEVAERAASEAAASDVLLQRQFAIELEDMSSGNYATRDNRAFADLAPLWARARADWVALHAPPNNRYVPAQLLLLPATITTLIAVDASTSTAWQLERVNGDWQIADAYYVSLGSAGVDKRRRGDQRTPLGVYWIVEELDSLALPDRYGIRVFPLDYPNALDRQQGRTGDGIWLHGIDPDNNIRPPRDTDGCIALVNERILSLGSVLTPGETPVIVTRELSWRKPTSTSDTLVDLTQSLLRWRDALQEQNADAYFALFSPDYTRFGLSTEQWRVGRVRALAAGHVSKVGIEGLSVLRTDEDEEIFVTRFEQIIHRTQGSPVRVLRRFYWRRNADGELRIIAEQNG
ncbi:MAG: L,D-transpeptidase family protein [Pseudomonadota bacterium]